MLDLTHLSENLGNVCALIGKPANLFMGVELGSATGLVLKSMSITAISWHVARTAASSFLMHRTMEKIDTTTTMRRCLLLSHVPLPYAVVCHLFAIAIDRRCAAISDRFHP